MNGGTGGLDGDLAVTQEQALLSSHPDVETFFFLFLSMETNNL